MREGKWGEGKEQRGRKKGGGWKLTDRGKLRGKW